MKEYTNGLMINDLKDSMEKLGISLVDTNGYRRLDDVLSEISYYWNIAFKEEVTISVEEYDELLEYKHMYEDLCK